MGRDWSRRFDERAQRRFVATGLGAFDDAIYTPKGGAPIEGVRCRVDRAMAFVGTESQVPQPVVSVVLWRSDVPAVQQGDRIAAGGETFQIDSARMDTSGEFDTYLVIPVNP